MACRMTASVARAAVHLPASVVDLLTGLRDYLQDKCEPPVYVSDRRFMKSINLLQVAAHADGRDEVGSSQPLKPGGQLQGLAKESCCLCRSQSTTAYCWSTYLGIGQTTHRRSGRGFWRPSPATRACSKSSSCSWACLVGRAASWKRKTLRYVVGHPCLQISCPARQAC